MQAGSSAISVYILADNTIDLLRHLAARKWAGTRPAGLCDDAEPIPSVHRVPGDLLDIAPRRDVPEGTSKTIRAPPYRHQGQSNPDIHAFGKTGLSMADNNAAGNPSILRTGTGDKRQLQVRVVLPAESC